MTLYRLIAVRLEIILVAVLLALAAYLYVEAPIHPTMSLKFNPPLLVAEPVGGLKRGNGPNLALARADLTDGAWRKEGVTVSAAAGTGPDGMKTAFHLAEIGDYGRHRIETSVTGTTAGAVHTLSFFVQPQKRTAVQFEMRDNQPGSYGVVQFQLAKKVVTYVSGDISDMGMQELPDGWFRCWAAMPYNGATAVFNLALTNNMRTVVYDGSRGSGIMVWGAQFELGPKPSGYAGPRN